MKFKKGDIVTVKSDLSTYLTYPIENQSLFGVGEVGVNSAMLKFRGREVEIEAVFSNGTYNIKESSFYWTASMFEEHKKTIMFFGERYKKLNTEYLCTALNLILTNKGYIAVNSKNVKIGLHDNKLFGNISDMNVYETKVDMYKIDEMKKDYTIYQVEHSIGGKLYDFRGDELFRKQQMVKCINKFGKVFGRVVKTKVVKMTEKKYMEYARIEEI